MHDENKTEWDESASSASSAPFDRTKGAPVLESEALFKGRNEVIIRHQGADYRMKITRQGKLILNK